MIEKLQRPLNWLIALLVVVIVSSLFASTVQNSFFSVDVDKISFETDNGELSGYLYLPNDVDESNPAPAVILTHGYLNNAEMQEIGAIELSRRGYVVLAFDMYDHGDSVWETPAQFNFFVRSVYDAVQYMYDQDYVLKDDDGNGMIGVSGHSMGGFSSTYAVVFDEMDFATNGYRKIAAALPVGSDLRYIGVPDPQNFFQSRSYGTIAAHYDQFFFDNSADPVGSVIYKDFVNDAVGLAILGRTDEGSAEAGKFYIQDGGQRVIYTPDETHPQNTWSLESGENTIEFFERAFTFQLNLAGLDSLESYGVDTGTTSQVWWLKEAFTLIGLLALIAMIFPLFTVLTKFPVFNMVYKKEEEEEENIQEETSQDLEIIEELPVSKEEKMLKTIVILLATLLSAYFLTDFMNRSGTGLQTLADSMYYLLGAVAFVVLAVWIASIFKDNNEKAVNIARRVTLYGLILVLMALLYRWFLTNTDLFTEATYYSAPSVNTIVYWAIASAGLIFLIVFGTAGLFNVNKEVKNPFGIQTTWKQLLGSAIVAITMTFTLLLLVALVEWIFLTDFRFYTYAIKIFNSHQFVAAFRYMPLFFIYFLAAAVTVYVNTRNCKNWKGDLLAAFLLAGPVVIFLVYQYRTLYNTGVAAYPTFSLSGILAMGLVPTLSFVAIISRRLSIKTGNIWTGVFFNTLFFILVTLANTTVYVLTIQ
ncbi:MAG: alpha/beta hydrolase [Candidatus Izemoplasmataceae bacterium]